MCVLPESLYLSKCVETVFGKEYTHTRIYIRLQNRMEGEFLCMQLFEGQEQTPYLNVIEVKPLVT